MPSRPSEVAVIANQTRSAKVKRWRWRSAILHPIVVGQWTLPRHLLSLTGVMWASPGPDSAGVKSQLRPIPHRLPLSRFIRMTSPPIASKSRVFPKPSQGTGEPPPTRPFGRPCEDRAYASRSGVTIEHCAATASATSARLWNEVVKSFPPYSPSPAAGRLVLPRCRCVELIRQAASLSWAPTECR